jgi:DMSO/TMAO reductase YedYZ molybdopterin-dependent catalytic subunit
MGQQARRDGGGVVRFSCPISKSRRLSLESSSTHAYQFNQPVATALSGTDLFVANKSGGSLPELDAKTGAPLRVISGATYGFANPIAIVSSEDDLFVANAGGGSVTEIPM